MSYQTPKTIADVLRLIERRVYVLPAIQREFVWNREQIEELFDSLMRGYPIGSFLFWEIESARDSGYDLYDFVADFDPRAPHSEPANLTGSDSVTAILDGQQRLTAMNVSIRGSFTEKTPRLRWDNSAAFVKRRLHLCLLHEDLDAAPDEPMYEFRFKSDSEAALENHEGEHFWLRVGDVLTFNPESLDHEDPLKLAGIDANPIARRNAYKLTQLVHKQGVVSYYLEADNDLDKVLNIFIRVNRGGTKLSYSDLLMSVATAHWKNRDAREEVHDLVDDVNKVGEGFSFSRDRILKASLVLADLKDIKLKAANMLDSMLTVERKWDEIDRSILLAARLLALFGLSRDTVTAENVIIPVAYYVHKYKLPDSYLTAPKYRDDRELIRSWVVRSLLRAGFWTGAVDTILVDARSVIVAHADGGNSGFPLVQIDKALEAKNKSLRFTEGELEDLLAVSYKSPRCVPLLTLLYGDAVRRHTFHTDHVFPRARLRKKAIEAAIKGACRKEETSIWLERVDQLPNLQLLTAAENTAKSDLLPLEWSVAQLEPTTRELRLAEADLDPLPESASAWFSWWEKRRALQEERIRKTLRMEPASRSRDGELVSEVVALETVLAER